MLPIAQRTGRRIRNRLPSRETRESCLAFETEAFEREVARFVERALGDRAGEGVEKTTLDLTGHVTAKTPQKTGRLAAAWLPFAASRGVHIPLTETAGAARGRREGRYRARLKGPRPYIELTNAAPHALPIELGARPHWITARPGGALRFPGPDGSYIYRKRVWHPGIRSFRPLKRSMRIIRRHLEANFERLVRP